MSVVSSPREAGASNCRRRTERPKLSKKYAKKVALTVVFVYIGITFGITGATLIYIEKMTASREDEVALIFSARAVGCLAGWLLGLLVLDLQNAFGSANLLGIGLFGLFIVHLILPWAAHVWWVMCGFVFQGSFMVITTQGCFACVRNSHLRYKPHWSQHVIFACLLGCVLAPFVAFPFLRGSVLNPNSRTLSLFLQQAKSYPNSHMVSTSVPDASLSIATVVKRVRRDAVSSILTSPVMQSAVPENTSNVLGSYNSRPAMTVISSSSLATTTTASTQSSEIPATSVTLVTSNVTEYVATTVMPVISKPDLDTASPMKPSINDAKHLNQDSSSADGSQTASKMKQLGEEHRMDSIAYPPVVQQLVTTVKPPDLGGVQTMPDSITTTVSKLVSTNDSSVVNTPSLPITTVAPIEDSVTPTILPSNITFATATIHVVELGVPEATTPSVSLSENAHATSDQAVSLSVTEAKTEKHETTATTGTSTFATTTTVTASTPTNISVNNTTNSSFSNYRKHIAEHRSTVSHTPPIVFDKPLLPVQKVYFLLSLMGFILWLCTLPLTGWFQRHCVFQIGTNRTVRNTETVRLKHMQSSRSCEMNKIFKPTEPGTSAEHRQPLLHAVDDNSTDSEHDAENIDSADESRYVSVREQTWEQSDPALMCKVPVSNGSKASVFDPSGVSHSSPLPSSLIYASIKQPKWPRLNWPSDAWLLSAEFFNVGLETTYGAFIHGFTMRYLAWSPALALFVLSLFWLGGLVGRLPGMYLLETKVPNRIHRRLVEHGNFTSLSLSQSSFSLSTSSTRWLLSVVRLLGALLSVVSAVALTRLSVSTDRSTFATDETARQTGATTGSHHYFTWLGGSLFLGLGVGISSSSTVGSVLATRHSVDAHRLQLAGLLGQLLVPPLVAYIHHWAGTWRYTCVLGGASLVLGILLSSSLIADLVRTVLLEQQATCVPRSVEERVASFREDDDPRVSSPVTLHSVVE
ncbi:hypothetical protein EG68_04268 [Paragonimus skrjabini miyazakii]|uniref:Uncharacterized protein n=1 Tax=Paragonimus skrjabini miyazakii TaxID=59628 RepID=A0A8S9YU33_9TREM|nr:hypothetical protein EG68_04268 [Paragonimus skrjabini miyazakii]